MGYFDRTADTLFRIDSKGNVLFYPWGLLGKVYILPDPAKKEEIRRFLNLFYAVSMVLVLITLITVDLYYSAAWLPLLFFWYWLSMHRMLRGSQTLKFAEACKHWASSFDLISLLFFAAASTLFVVGSVFVLLRFPSDWFAVLIGIIGVLFFGAGGFVFVHMIKAKKKEEAEKQHQTPLPGRN